MTAKQIRPYEQLTDAELNDLVAGAADLRLRLAMLSPGEVRETLIAHGCAKVAATRMVTDPMMRGHAARFHLDTQDALLGDPEALARMQHVEHGWEALRRRAAPESAEEAVAR